MRGADEEEEEERRTREGQEEDEKRRKGAGAEESADGADLSASEHARSFSSLRCPPPRFVLVAVG